MDLEGLFRFKHFKVNQQAQLASHAFGGGIDTSNKTGAQCVWEVVWEIMNSEWLFLSAVGHIGHITSL